jgi:hypothetical protein
MTTVRLLDYNRETKPTPTFARVLDRARGVLAEARDLRDDAEHGLLHREPPADLLSLHTAK